MDMWLYIDPAGRVLGANPNGMTGNTGWECAEVPEEFNVDTLFDSHGAALYELMDGQLVERSEDARRADWPPEPMPELPVDLQQLRADVDFISMMTGVEL